MLLALGPVRPASAAVGAATSMARIAARTGYILSDARGSVLARTSFDGATVAEEAEYDPWGATMGLGAGLAAPVHQFTGVEPDRGTGLYHFGVRAYDPTLRRWLSPDPLLAIAPDKGVDSGEVLNLYGYANNNPVAKVDLAGREPGDNAARASAALVFGPGVARDMKKSDERAIRDGAPIVATGVPLAFAAGLTGPAALVAGMLRSALVGLRAAPLVFVVAAPFMAKSEKDVLPVAVKSAEVSVSVALVIGAGSRAPNPSIVVRQPTVAEGVEVADALAWERQAVETVKRGNFAKKPAVVIGRFDPATGEAGAFASRPGAHAEEVAAEAMPNGFFSRPITVRANNGAGAYADVCARVCEPKFGRGAFPPGRRSRVIEFQSERSR